MVGWGAKGPEGVKLNVLCQVKRRRVLCSTTTTKNVRPSNTSRII